MIKRIALTLTALALALTLSLGTMAITPQEAAAAPDNVTQFCQDDGREALAGLIFFLTRVRGVDVSQGACVSLLRAENPTALIVNFCQTEQGRAFLSRFGDQEVNTGQCVRIVKSIFR